MKNNVKISVIGHFGGNKKFSDGQTIKTITVYKALEKYSGTTIRKVDTFYIRKNPIIFFHMLFVSFIQDQKFVVLLSSSGRKFLFPVFYVMSRYLKKEIYHYAIGGRLADEVQRKKNWKKYISSFNGNWMESQLLVNKLKAAGIKNAVYIPNFKALPILKESDLKIENNEPFHLCVFSRIMKEKGVEDAIQAVTNINTRYRCQKVLLDLYGPIVEGYEDQFKQCIGQSNDACHYCGVVPAEESVNTLKRYFVLLFPTHWLREGMPGTIIDALSAGLPVIARQWIYCTEMLEHGKTGYIYEFDRPDKLDEMIEYAITHVDETNSMKKHCLKKAEQYSEPYVMGLIMKQMEI